MSVWYRSRLNCELHGVEWASVRCHMFARAISDFASTGSRSASFAPAVFDSRFFPFQFSDKQSTLTAKETREVIAWGLEHWPDWSVKDFVMFSPITWLEVLNPQDKEKTLEILEEYYGLRRFK